MAVTIEGINCITYFSPHNDPRRWNCYLFYFTDEKTDTEWLNSFLKVTQLLMKDQGVRF